jgi:hypothetical protein
VPVDGKATAAREAISFTTATGAGVARATTDLLALDADGDGPAWEARAADLWAAPRVAEGADAEAADLTFDAADSVDPVSSANADGAEASNPPIPKATARAPTRPT